MKWRMLLHFKRMLHRHRHSFRIRSPALILPISTISVFLPGGSCRTFKSFWMFCGSIVELIGKEDMRCFDLEHCSTSDTTKTERSEWGGSQRLKISTDLSVLDSFVWLFLSSMASCDTISLVMNITCALMSVMNSRQERCWMLLVWLWIFDSSPQFFSSFLWLGFVSVPSRACSLLVWLRTQAFECETVAACYGLRVLLFLAFVWDSWELRTEASSQNLKNSFFTGSISM